MGTSFVFYIKLYNQVFNSSLYQNYCYIKPRPRPSISPSSSAPLRQLEPPDRPIHGRFLNYQQAAWGSAWGLGICLEIVWGSPVDRLDIVCGSVWGSVWGSGGSAGLSGELLENCLSGLAWSAVPGKNKWFYNYVGGGTVGHSLVFPEEKKLNERQAALVSWQALVWGSVPGSVWPDLSGELSGKPSRELSEES